MKTGWKDRTIACVLAVVMTVCMAAACVPAAAYAEEAKSGGKYVSDVFVAYGKTEDDAAKWLKKNGWEPVKGDLNAGKASFFDDNKIQDQNVAAVMGIKRTDEKDEAITDMAVMNMTGGYSLPDYEELLKEKKGEIKEFINRFIAAIEEFRSNYKGEGSEFGQERANIAFDILNKFYDGDPEDPDAVNDTGKKMGDLFMEKTRQEGNENGADLEQIILESNGAAVVAMETFLALGADNAEDTWLERASGLTGDELAENLPEYVPEAAGQDIAPSAIGQYLGQKYGGTAAVLAKQWSDINEKMIWFEDYNEEYGLWPEDNEGEEAYQKRLDQHFKALSSDDADEGQAEQSKYMNAMILYHSLYEVPYRGDWGESLGDLFNPADGADYSQEENFLPMAAALSPGQRASTDLLSLQMLLMIGLGSNEAFEKTLPDIEEIFGDKIELSIYTGVNRAAFRGGVALTSEALMQQNAGNGNAYDQMWNNMGTVAIASYVAAVASVPMIIAGGVMAAKGVKFVNISESHLEFLQDSVKYWKKSASDWTRNAKALSGEWAKRYKTHAKESMKGAEKCQKELDEHTVPSKSGYAGRVLLGIGGALLVGAAVVKGIQLYKYYDRDMLPIPRMIVDESDVVTYLTDDEGNPLLDANGKQKKNTEFNTYEYYDSVKCNRPEVGEIGDWNDGVEDYKNSDNYCYDIADLNADMGQEWVALYTVKSRNKGNPVLADSLTVQYGKKDKPEGCTQALHLFTYTNAVDLGDTAWAYNNAKKGVYFFWDTDENAFAKEAASTFGTGQMALAGIGGLLLGIAGATLVLNKKRKKDELEAA